MIDYFKKIIEDLSVTLKKSLLMKSKIFNLDINTAELEKKKKKQQKKQNQQINLL